MQDFKDRFTLKNIIFVILILLVIKFIFTFFYVHKIPPKYNFYIIVFNKKENVSQNVLTFQTIYIYNTKV